IKKAQANLHRFQDLLKDLTADNQPGKETEQAPMQKKPACRMTYKDLPVFQLSGAHIWHHNKEVFSSPSHFARTFELALSAMEGDLDRDWEKWLPLAIHHDHDA
ncbi:hypothetical protein BDB00DRAFT_284122, partial [Zychaea mexicana]|uniref:uncharacterized protein n=1 Tax=Zychaea mexicana TaxID=64656 RepID=UPI0022FEC49C